MGTFVIIILVGTALAALVELFTDRRRYFFVACLFPVAFAIFLAFASAT